MKPHGYYWCDRCDDNAYGKTCQHCQSPTRWIASELPKIRTADPVAKKLFQQMRDAVATVAVTQSPEIQLQKNHAPL